MRTSRGTAIPGILFSQPEARWTILFRHGNAEDPRITASYANELSFDLMAKVLCYAENGYDLSFSSSDGHLRSLG